MMLQAEMVQMMIEVEQVEGLERRDLVVHEFEEAQESLELVQMVEGELAGVLLEVQGLMG
jgi:hypothetical protein